MDTNALSKYPHMRSLHLYDNVYDMFPVFGPSVQVRMKSTGVSNFSLPDGTHLKCCKNASVYTALF